MNKKQKTSELDRQKSVSTSTGIRICYIAKLPVELLAEILLYTKSPKDVLALTRCSKSFCRTLLHEANQYIWRYARRNCLPEALPEPCSRFTESSFAAFVFDNGPCEMCGVQVDFYKSFGLRVRLCDNSACKNSFNEDKLHIDRRPKQTYKIFGNTLAVVESTVCFMDSQSIQEWPDITMKYRQSDWTCALQEYLDASRNPNALEKFIDLCSEESARTKTYMQLCVTLQRWKQKYLEAQVTMKDGNIQLSKALAARKGLSFWDMMNTPTYESLFRQKNAALEEIEQLDYDMREADIGAELIKVVGRRSRRAHEAGYSTCCRAVEKHYNRLRALKQNTPLPCLPSFRKLPTIHQIQHSTSQSEKELDRNLQSQPIQTLVHSELEKFHLEAKNALAGVLGFPNWKSPSNRKLHPADRLTARFQCKQCWRVEVKYKESESLDYAGAIMHLCSVTLDKPVSAMPFKATRFERDTKAIAAMSALLTACDISDDEKGSHALLSIIGPRVLCLSCEAQIVLEPFAVLGHSHRHESMSLALLPQSEVKKILGDHPLSNGLVVRLMSAGKIALEMRTKRVYMCRHCDQLKRKAIPIPSSGTVLEGTGSNETSIGDADISSSTPAIKTRIASTDNSASNPHSTLKPNTTGAMYRIHPAPANKPSLYIFDGLRSHLKEVHKIHSVRDEDIICIQDL
ncbi:hypothetical protein J3R30DRAFT_34975 [Lentinula aciculospora]|uniref:F-box domain-containing protein n=1 Tax=Lentinula aciculospora TaxID=153920 RepID=A0A9W9DX66_9AGAR|nr:hypothetical protein J3R30DRAFT_34975 [Lentinula aciculospora]